MSSDPTAPTVDLAVRSIGGSVLAANDESFGEKENLLKPGPGDFTPGNFGHKGEIVDGWETRRRRVAGHDWALIRLGSAGVVTSVDVDTSFFTGNSPVECVVEGCGVEGYPPPEALIADESDWEVIVPRSALKSDSHNLFEVTSTRRFSHVRLSIFPDGGVARLRVNGHVCPDPRRFDRMTVDLAGRENGGLVVLESNRFYYSAGVINQPGLAPNMGQGWETRRLRGEGNDWVIIKLSARGILRQLEVDTSYYKFNASGAFALQGWDGTGQPAEESDGWFPLIPRTTLQPDTRQFFDVDSTRSVTYVRFDAFPDGGLSRLRLRGTVTAEGRESLAYAWLNALPRSQAIVIIASTCDVTADVASQIADLRPFVRGESDVVATGALPADGAAVDADMAGEITRCLRTLIEGRSA